MAHDDDELEEYVDDEPTERGGRRGRLVIPILAVGCVALAVSNIVLATRLIELRRTAAVDRPAAERVADAQPAPESAPASEPAASVAAPAIGPASAAPPRPTPVPPRPVAVPPTAGAPAVSEARRAERAPRAESRRPEPSARAEPSPPPEPAPRRVATPPQEVETAAPAPSTAELPPRSVPRPARVATARAETEPSSPAWQRERSTASWMVREYGRSYAESRARAAAAFYDARSPEGAYWRRVLAEIVAADR